MSFRKYILVHVRSDSFVSESSGNVAIIRTMLIHVFFG